MSGGRRHASPILGSLRFNIKTPEGLLSVTEGGPTNNVPENNVEFTTAEELVILNELAQEVASSCGFDFVPPIHLRRGRGGDWNPRIRCVRIGRSELWGDDDHLWYILAHELAHAQAEQREGHSKEFWTRLANGLKRAGRLELLRYDFGYREAALRVAEESGLPDVPKRSKFRFALGTVLEDGGRRRWKIQKRFRRAGEPHYRLNTRGWRWIASEQRILSEHTVQRFN